jgi:CheY-like chemotaxis protein
MGAPATEKTLLLVEDDADIRELLSDALRDQGYEVVGAGNGSGALGHLRSGLRPSLILLDLMMPVMNGWEFRERQRQDPSLADIPVLLLSADGAGDRHVPSLEAVGCLKKPFELDALLEAIARYAV